MLQLIFSILWEYENPCPANDSYSKLDQAISLDSIPRVANNTIQKHRSQTWRVENKRIGEEKTKYPMCQSGKRRRRAEKQSLKENAKVDISVANQPINHGDADFPKLSAPNPMRQCKVCSECNQVQLCSRQFGISGAMVISVSLSAKAARLWIKPSQQTTQSSSSSRINFPSLYFSELS